MRYLLPWEARGYPPVLSHGLGPTSETGQIANLFSGTGATLQGGLSGEAHACLVHRLCTGLGVMSPHYGGHWGQRLTHLNLRADLWPPASCCPPWPSLGPQRYWQKGEAGGTRICHLENSRLRDCTCCLEISPHLSPALCVCCPWRVRSRGVISEPHMGILELRRPA